MKKYDFKKMAALGLAVGLSIAAPSSACCGRDKHDKNDSSDLLSTLNKASEGFYLAGGGCAGGPSGKCSGQNQSHGTGTSRGNVAEADAMQGGSMQNGSMQNGTMQNGSMQNGRMQNGTMQNGRMQNGTMQNGKMQNDDMDNDSNSSMQNDNNNMRNNNMQNGNMQNNNMRPNTNNMRGTSEKSHGCAGIAMVSGLNNNT